MEKSNRFLSNNTFLLAPFSHDFSAIWWYVCHLVSEKERLF